MVHIRLCTSASFVAKKGGYFSIYNNCVEIRMMFLTDNIIRIRAGFDGDFAEGSYSLAPIAWDDLMDGVMKGYKRRVAPAAAELTAGEKETVIQGRSLKLSRRSPFRICVYDSEGTQIHADILDLAFMEDSPQAHPHLRDIHRRLLFRVQ